MPPRKNEAQMGLRLSLPGAPNTPHTVPGVQGFFWPDRPVPVGGPDDPISIDRARELDADPGLPLELVECPDPDAARADAAAFARVAAGELAAAVRDSHGDAREIAVEQAATAAALADPEED